MLQNLWYVVAESRHVRAEPIAVRLLGQEFALFRNAAGEAVLLSDVCIHRGGSLSAGRLIGGEIECPYHGWRFGSDGRCTRIPSDPGARIPDRARVDAYPVVERYGWAWAFIGDLSESDRPPLPALDWVLDPSFRVLWGYYDWSSGTNWERVMENGLDFAHAPFVHGSAFGDRDRPQIDAFEVVRDDWSGQATMVMHPPPMKGLWAMVGGRERVPVEAVTRFHMSGPCVTLMLRPRGSWCVNLVNAHVPIDETTTRTWWIQGRNFMRGAWADRNSRRRNTRIFEQDDVILRKVRPEHVPESWREEVSVRSDALQVEFRKRLHALEDRGWKIDSTRIERELRSRSACAVPCPARRTWSSWVLPPIPLRTSDAITHRSFHDERETEHAEGSR